MRASRDERSENCPTAPGLKFSVIAQHHRSVSKVRKFKPMSRQREEALRWLIDHPPEGSAIAEAKKFGVDLYSILENLKLTPAERFRRAAEETDFVRRVRGIQKASK
jgi:hypothetical protein